MQGVEHYVKNGTYCYSVGHYAHFNEARDYLMQVHELTPYKDAWVLLRKPAEEPQKVSPTPSATPTARPATPAQSGIEYRIQFLTTNRELKAGDPELHGIKQFRTAQVGRYWICTTGPYTTRADADNRLAELRRTTPFKDAFVIGIKNGERVNID